MGSVQSDILLAVVRIDLCVLVSSFSHKLLQGGRVCIFDNLSLHLICLAISYPDHGCFSSSTTPGAKFLVNVLVPFRQ